MLNYKYVSIFWYWFTKPFISLCRSMYVVASSAYPATTVNYERKVLIHLPWEENMINVIPEKDKRGIFNSDLIFNICTTCK